MHLQGVQRLQHFMICLFQRLDVLKYSYQMVHSLARHGRFDYLTETFRLSQCDALQSHPNSEVKIKHMHNIPLLGHSSFFKFLLFGFQMCLNPLQGQFWKPQKLRNVLNTISFKKFKGI